MSTSQDAPDLIQYACERCKTRFVLPASSRRLGIRGSIRAFGIGLGRTLRYREGLGASIGAAQRNQLAKVDDKAYQSFVKSFRFCHECRQFVCNDCWSDARRSCLTCVAKAMSGTARPRPPFAPVGPDIPRPVAGAGPDRRRRIRRDLALVSLALGLILVAVEVGVLFANAGTPDPTSPTIVATPSPSPTVQATPSQTPVATPTASPSPTATPTPAPVATPTPSPTASPAPTPTPTPTPRVTPRVTPKPPTPPPVTPAPTMPTLPTPTIQCSVAGTQWSCIWTNQNQMGDAGSTWWVDSGDGRGPQNLGLNGPPWALPVPPPGGPYHAYLVVSQAGYRSAQSGTQSYP